MMTIAELFEYIFAVLLPRANDGKDCSLLSRLSGPGEFLIQVFSAS